MTKLWWDILKSIGTATNDAFKEGSYIFIPELAIVNFPFSENYGLEVDFGVQSFITIVYANIKIIAF